MTMVLLHALEKSRTRGGVADRNRTSAWRVAPKLKLSASVPGTGTGAETEIDLTGLKGEPPTNLLAPTPIQRETAHALAVGASRPFSRAFRAALGAELGEESPSEARVQAALRRLERAWGSSTPRGESGRLRIREWAGGSRRKRRGHESDDGGWTVSPVRRRDRHAVWNGLLPVGAGTMGCIG